MITQVNLNASLILTMLGMLSTLNRTSPWLGVILCNWLVCKRPLSPILVLQIISIFPMFVAPEIIRMLVGKFEYQNTFLIKKDLFNIKKKILRISDLTNNFYCWHFSYWFHENSTHSKKKSSEIPKLHTLIHTHL